MRFLHVVNGWTFVPELWRELLWPPIQIQRELTLALDQDGELRVLETPATYSVQVLGVVLFLEVGKGLRA